jgi:hypothetical protein
MIAFKGLHLPYTSKINLFDVLDSVRSTLYARLFTLDYVRSTLYARLCTLDDVLCTLDDELCTLGDVRSMMYAR